MDEEKLREGLDRQQGQEARVSTRCFEEILPDLLTQV